MLQRWVDQLNKKKRLSAIMKLLLIQRFVQSPVTRDRNVKENVPGWGRQTVEK